MTSARNSTPARARGFTLLELMLVIALIAIVFVGMTPLMTASMRERKLRNAADDVVEMVRGLRADAQTDGRRRVVEMRSKGFFNRSSRNREQLFSPPGGAEFFVRLPGGKWEKPAQQTWDFSPVGMVTPYSVRIEQDGAWIEVDFDLLTGRVAEERYAF